MLTQYRDVYQSGCNVLAARRKKQTDLQDIAREAREKRQKVTEEQEKKLETERKEVTL